MLLRFRFFLFTLSFFCIALLAYGLPAKSLASTTHNITISNVYINESNVLSFQVSSNPDGFNLSGNIHISIFDNDNPGHNDGNLMYDTTLNNWTNISNPTVYTAFTRSSNNNFVFEIFDDSTNDLYFATGVTGSMLSTPPSTPTPTPTPTSAAQIVTDPSSSTATVGTPFYVNVKVESNTLFNAAQATVTVPNDVDIIADSEPSSNTCGMFLVKNDRTQHTYTFAGAITGGSSTSCTVRKLTIMPNASGSKPIGLSTYSVKDSTISADIPTTADEGSVTVNDGPTAIPTVGLSALGVTSRLKTYYGAAGNEYILSGTYEDPITTVYVDSVAVTPAPSNGEWHKSGITLDLGEGNKSGDNQFTIYGSYGSNQTATQVLHIERHLLGDIDGNGKVDLGDASMLATDYEQSPLTYALSNMNYDQDNPDDVVDITDLSILARNWNP